MEYGIQIASICFMVSILYNYFKNKRLPLRSTKVFTGFIIIGILNLVFEGLTLYSIHNLDIVPAFINRLFHQLFIGSIDLIVFFLYLYVDIKSRKQEKYTKKQIIIRLIPIIITLFIIIFGDLKYVAENNCYYSYGAMANTIFVFVALYISVIIFLLFKRKNMFSKQEKLTIILGISTWAIISIIQFFNKSMLLSSLAIVMMIQFIFISFENSDKYLAVNDVCLFNKESFILTANELIEEKEEFNIIRLNILVQNESNEELVNKIYENFFKKLIIKINGLFFKIKDNVLYIVFLNKNQYLSYLNNKLEKHTYIYNNKEYEIKILKKGIENKNYKTVDEIIEVLEKRTDYLVVYKSNKQYKLNIGDIYYIEALENQTFIYTSNECFEIKDKLYQLEELLFDNDFLRTSKSMIINLNKIKSLENYENSKMMAVLLNDESVIVSRKYVKDLKSKINIK